MTPRLFATSDIHISHRSNHAALATMGHYPDDWLIVAGDVGERALHLHQALDELQPRFARVIWTPGNHDLWCPAGAVDRTRGLARYEELVAICHERGVLTPEDPYEELPSSPGTYIVPMFLLFDYSFRPPDVREVDARDWARTEGVLSGDEWMIDPSPFGSIPEWCADRCVRTAARLDALPLSASTVLINHWPLRYDLARSPRVPLFSIWSGTTRTENWAVRYRATAVISGHLHLRTTLWRDGVRYEEVSLGYPRDWNPARGIDWYLREILPGTPASATRSIPYRDPYL